MTYSEAIKELYNKPWKVSTCSQGEFCWCRIIESVEPIVYREEDEDKFSLISKVIPMGIISSDFAEHVVKLHNEFLEKKSEKI
jgi:hypothetical protein